MIYDFSVIYHPASSNWHPSSVIQHLSSCIRHPSSCILHLVSKFSTMKPSTLFLMFIFFGLVSCRFEQKTIEATYPDGLPKRICWYIGKGGNREMIRETTFYPNKQKQMEGAYKDNERDGQWTYWYENGKLWSQGNFINGKADGKRTAYFENGKVRYEGFYKEDMRIGKWRFYDETGRLLQEVDYSALQK